jgi:hypothetical protein
LEYFLVNFDADGSEVLLVEQAADEPGGQAGFTDAVAAQQADFLLHHAASTV